jgi:ubiquinone/menaquinone biosynthesis C-methylase UbiE
MIQQIKKRIRTLKPNAEAIVMDGQCLEFRDNSFDIIILHLILAVIPNPIACIKETERVLKPGGRVVVFDKFVRKNSKVSKLRKFANILTNFMFSDITRTFETIAEHSGFTLLTDEDADFNGNFRLIKMIKNKNQ